MADIIDFRAERAKRAEPNFSYFVRVDLYDDGVCGALIDVNDTNADLFRTSSDHLFALARHLRDMAWQESKDDDDRQIAVVRVYASSRVNTWTSNDCETPEQMAWLDERLNEAVESARA
jgi:hypothetical protein